MARAVVVKVARRGRKAAVLVKVVRSMLGDWDEVREGENTGMVVMSWSWRCVVGV